MFSSRRIQALFLLIAVLVVSFGMFAPPAFSVTCSDAKAACCESIVTAQHSCAFWGPNHLICLLLLEIARQDCNAAKEACGRIVAHECFGG